LGTDSRKRQTLKSRSPHCNNFDPGDEGKTAYYALRWLNTKGDPGQWSQIYSLFVLGEENDANGFHSRMTTITPETTTTINQ
jgi:hypothetical protein